MNTVQEQWIFMKVWEVLTIFLLVVSGSIYIFLSEEHPALDIGIVLLEGMDDDVGAAITEGLDEYDEYFDAKILDHRLNDSDVRMKGGFKLISDHFRSLPLENLRTENDVDIVLIVTSEMIQDWDNEKGKGFWGKADPSYDAALITIYYWMMPTGENRTVWAHLAVHEIMHLLGYTHNSWDTSGVMQYADNTDRTDLATYYDFQLPIRTSLHSIISGTNFRLTVFIPNTAVALLMLPLAMAEELIVSRAHEKLTGARLPKWLSPLSLTGCFFLLFAVTGSFAVLIFTLMFTIGAHTMVLILTDKKKN
jgi:hypothetical protein